MKDLKDVIELEFKPKTNAFGWRVFELTGETNVAAVRGSSLSTYTLLPVQWAKQIVDAARPEMRFLETVRQEVVPENTDQIIIPKRKKYLDESSWTSGGEEPTSEITKTSINTPDGVALKPTDYTYLVGISYKALRTCALNMTQYAREEMARFYESLIDSIIRNHTMGDSNSTESELTAAPTPMSNTVNGAQTIFGGDATAADGSLDTGDVLTTDLIKRAITLLSSDIGYYWASTTTFAKSSVSKNPWTPTKQEPFVFFMANEQWEALMNESQFTNAAEFGSQEPVLTGEIAQYMGVRMIVTHKCTKFTNGDYIYLDGTINPKMDVDGHICMLAKAQRYGAVAFGQKPTIKVFDYPSSAEVRLMLHLAVAASEIHPDAIVRVVVSDR